MQIEALFEKEFYEIAKNITFRETEQNYGSFQNKMKKDLNILKN